MAFPQPLRTAVLIPCRNQAATIAETIADFRRALPDAPIYVYDDGSTDGSVTRAKDAGAIVRTARRRGFGEIARRMFADIEADAYLVVDGPGYDAAQAPRMIWRLFHDRLDMVNARRSVTPAVRHGDVVLYGSRLMSRIVGLLFDERMTDMLSGCKVLSRRFVKSFPCLADDTDLETELAIHAVALHLPFVEAAMPYRVPQMQSIGWPALALDRVRFVASVVRLVRQERPSRYFGIVALILALVAAGTAWPLLHGFAVGNVFLSVGFLSASLLCLTWGMLLEGATLARREAKRLAYLAIPVAERGEMAELEIVEEEEVPAITALPAANDAG